MAFLIFDACALIALSEKEKGAEVLASFLVDNENTCFVHSIKLCEVYYRACRNYSKEDAITLVEEFLKLGVILRDYMDIEFWQDAGELKAIHKRVSLADCCAIALAKRLDAELVTSDHHELNAWLSKAFVRSHSLDILITRLSYSRFTIHGSRFVRSRPIYIKKRPLRNE